MAADRIVCRIFVFKSSLGFVCRRKFPKPVPESALSARIYGGRDQQFWRILPHLGVFYEAQRCGTKIELPCINRSRNETRISGKTIFIGFVHVQNLEQSVISAILNERQQHGIFSSLSDFIERTAITKEQLVILIRLGALRFPGISKAELLWKAHMLLNKTVPVARTKALFESKPREFVLPKLEQSVLGDAWDEIELIGFPVSDDYF